MMKNALDVIFGGLSYWSVGFALSFGHSWHGIVGYSDFFTTVSEESEMGTTYAQYFYQLALCTTSTTVGQKETKTVLRPTFHILKKIF